MSPWLTAEEVYREAGRHGYLTQRSGSGRNEFRNTHVYFASLLEGISELPKTI